MAGEKALTAAELHEVQLVAVASAQVRQVYEHETQRLLRSYSLSPQTQVEPTKFLLRAKLQLKQLEFKGPLQVRQVGWHRAQRNTPGS